jgi:hypothetical protein
MRTDTLPRKLAGCGLLVMVTASVLFLRAGF